MRMIDADALKASIPETETDIFENCGTCTTLMDYEVKDLINKQPTITASPWHRVEEELPESNDAVNVVWVNRNPESYYADIKDKPFVATAHFHNGKWYWFSATCKDFLDEYGRCDADEVDGAIDILYWMPMPEPPINRKFT